MEIKQLDKQEYQGREYSAEFHSDRYLSIDPDNFSVLFPSEMVYSFGA